MAKRLILITILVLYCLSPFGRGNSCETFLGIKLGQSTIKDVLSMMGPCNRVYLDSQAAESDTYGKSPNYIVFEYIRDISVVNKNQTALISFVFDLVDGKVIRIIFEFNFIRNLNKEDVLVFFGKPDRIIHKPIVDDKDNFEGIVLDCDSPDGEVESLLYIKDGLEITLAPPDQYKIIGGRKVRLINGFTYDLDICSGKKIFPKCLQKE